MKGKLIWLILGIALILRLVLVPEFPAGFNADEASFGYDAYSILKTGKDQWGSFLPIALKSFGDYKSPLYSYLTIPFVGVFGLNAFSVRIVSVLIGTFSVFAAYLLTRRLTKSENIGLVAAALVAVNPWSVMISRGAVEANLITFFLPMGIYLFLQKKYSLSAFFLGLNLFSYHASKIITPLVILGLIFVYWRDISKFKVKNFVWPLAILAIFFAGLIYSFKIGGGSRITERSITQGALEQGFQERMKMISSGANPAISKALHNKYTVISKRFMNNYFQYFSFSFLFERGAGDGSYAMIPGIGVIYVFEGLLLLGIIPLFLIKKDFRSLTLALVVWLLITPLPAALASGIGYSGNRASGMIPVLQIIEALGLSGWFLVVSKAVGKNVVYGLVVIFLILAGFNIKTFIGKYYKVPDNKVLRQMGYGNLEMAGWIGQNSEQKNVILSRGLSEPQIFVALENKINPIDYQNSTSNWDLKGNNVSWVDQLPSYKLAGYTIKSVDWQKDFVGRNLIVVRADELQKNTSAVKIFYYPNGTPNIYIIDAGQKNYAEAY